MGDFTGLRSVEVQVRDARSMWLFVLCSDKLTINCRAYKVCLLPYKNHWSIVAVRTDLRRKHVIPSEGKLARGAQTSLCMVPILALFLSNPACRNSAACGRDLSLCKGSSMYMENRHDVRSTLPKLIYVLHLQVSLTTVLKRQTSPRAVKITRTLFRIFFCTSVRWLP